MPVTPVANGKVKADEEPSAFMEGLHGVLDVVGMIPVIGEVADAANAGIYLAQGDYANAAMSAASMIPLAGNVVGAAKLAKTGLKLADKLGGAAQLAKKGANLATKAVDAVKGPLKKLRKGCGDPVDVASGEVMADAIDFSLPGPIPLVWERSWFSSATRQGALGHGWTHAYDWAIIAIAQDGTVGIRDGEGRLVAFEVPVAGGKGMQAERLALFLTAEGSYRVWHMDELRWYVFGVAKAGQEYAQPLQAIEDPNGFAIRFGYNEQHQLQTITDSAGRLLRVDNNEAGQLLAVHSPQTPDMASFVLVQYEYDASGNLITVIDAEGHPMRYRYEGHQLVQRTARTGTNWYFQYENQSPGARCVHTWGDGGLLDYTLYYDSESQTTVLDSYQHPTVYTHQNGLVTRQIDALGGEQLWTYSEAGQLLAYRDALGGITRYQYNEHGQQTLIVTADGSTQSIHYDEYDLPKSATNAVGGQWEWHYDQRGNLSTQTDPVGATTSYNYDERGQLITVVDPMGQSIKIQYDEQSNVAHIITPDDAIRSQEHDGLGRLIGIIDADGSIQKRRYDRLGQLVEVEEADGTRRRLTYDPSGNVVEAQQGEQRVEFAYTGLGQLMERRESGQRLQFMYDQEGRLTDLLNEAGSRYRFGINATGHVVEEEGFDGLIRRYKHNAAGNVIELIRPSGQTVQYDYTTGGQIAAVIHSDGTQATYAYDAAGAMIEARNEAATVYLRRDLMSRIVGEIQGGHQVSSIYDGLGQRTALTSSLGADLSLSHDLVGNLASMQAASWQAQFGYDSRGLEVHRQLSGGVRISRQHNRLGRVAEQQFLLNSQTHVRANQWQEVNYLGSVSDSRLGITRFSHDVFGNLTQAEYSDGSQELRLPDAVGNLFEDAAKEARSYGSGGQLLTTPTARYTYDEEGNLTRKETNKGAVWQYRWNGSGLLQEVIRPDESIVRFAYDALGRRISKTYKGKTTHWVWDGDKPLHEWQTLSLDGQNTEEIITWLFEEDSFSPIGKLQGQTRHSILTDYLGTPLEMVDQSGQRTWQAETTTAYGRVRLSEGTRADCPFRFPGQYEDVETGLYYNRARYYDPETGRYISQDPLRLMSGETNLYAYVEDPSRFIDVLGLAHGAELGNVADSILYHIKINGETFKYGIGSEAKVTKRDISILAPDKTTKIIPKGTSTRLYAQLRKAYSNFDDVVVETTNHPATTTKKMRELENAKIDDYFDRKGKVPSGNTGHAVGGREAEDLFSGVKNLVKDLKFKCNK